jgi:hypothetical protein
VARPVTVWLGATLLACAVCAAAYLPPRGLPRWAWTVRTVSLGDNQSRVRARRLADEWLEVNAALQALRLRSQVTAAVAARREAESAGPVLLVEGADTFSIRVRPLMQAGLDSLWSRLQIGESKIAVAVMVRDPFRQEHPVRLERSSMARGLSFILPDTSDRTTCLVQARLPLWLRGRRYFAQSDLVSWAASVLGPCAFYARFGMPSPRVEQWLARRQFDLAMVPIWGWSRRTSSGVWEPDDPEIRDRWWSYQLYSFPRATAACFAGRPDACRRSLTESDRGAEGPRPRVVAPRDQWGSSRVLLIGADQFLSEVVTQAGPERFQEFWTTSLPVDSALTLALGEPVGEFTVRYQRGIGPSPRFGAATTPLDASLGLAFALLVGWLTMAAQVRREVR